MTIVPPNRDGWLVQSDIAPMTAEQERQQRISFVLGNVGMSNPSLTREMVEAVVDGAAPANDNAPRNGDWIQTFTGASFYPLDPRGMDMRIADIAHSLSLQCRYAGHCLRFYSVAEHSVLLSRYVAPEHRLWALLHDASETYLVDVPRPVKPALGGYKDIERNVMGEIAKAFGLRGGMPAEVHDADIRICVDEKAQNMAPGPMWGIDGLEPLGVTLQFWSPAEAEAAFLDAFAEITRSI